VNVRAGNGGSIAINARNLDVLQGSKVRAGIASGLGSPQSEAGDIEINATEIMTVAGELSFLANVVLPEGVGKAGDINITTGSLFVKEGGYFNSSTQGQGDAGNLTINARDTVSFDSADTNGGTSGAFSTVLEGSVGNGGSINITTGSLFVTNGAQLIVGTAGQGDAGSLKISATDTVRFDGVSSNGFPSAAFNDVEAGAVGDGGDIEINTGFLEVTNGAILFADTAGQGDAGSVRISATDTVRFDGGNASISVDVGAVGDGGDIEINTGSLEVINGAQLFASTFGQGNAGSVRIVASDSVSFDGVGSNGISSTAISSVGTGAVGDGGDIEITTGSLEVSNGAFLFASTSGQGNAGNVRIRATDTVSFGSVGSDGLSSSASSSVLSGGVGDGGDIEINTGSLEVINGATLFADTNGRGSAGSVRITASDTVSFGSVGSDGLPSIATSSVAEGGVGDGGDVEITTGTLEVTNGADLSAATFGQGNSGSVRISATDTVRFDGGDASSAVVIGAVGDGGDVEITTGTLEVTNDAELSAGTFGQGNSGSVRISASDTVRLDGSFTASDVGPGAVGDGGDVEITTGMLEVTNGAILFAATAGRGNAGSVRITASDTVRFDGGDASSAVGIGAVGDGGDVEITTGTLEVTNDAFLSAATGGKGNAGNVRITASDTVRFDGSSALSAVAEGGVGNGGDVEITTGTLEVTNGAFLIGGTIGQGNAGAVRINATDSVNFDGGGASSFVGPTGVGDGGDIEITTGSLSLTDAFISSESQGTGTAGDITLETRKNLEMNRSSILATTQVGNGGNIRLRMGDLLLMRNDSNISTTAGVASAGGDGGNININAGFVVAVPREDSDITANAFNGRGGNINITTQGIYGLEFRERDLPASSDITASSQFGLDGEFQLDLLSAVDPSRGLVQLPTNVVDASEQIDRRCTPSGTVGEGSSFSVTGRGGLPASPNETLQGESTVVNWVSLESEAEHNTSSGITKLSNAAQGQHVEAQGWMRDEKGQVVLTAQASEITPHSGWLDKAKCQVFQRPETPHP
jgi:large exoprotein involved in heme utilization and adhesion